jgi:hypothetical protein
VSNENFRRELGNAFDDIAGSPSHGLSDRVRSSLANAPEQHGPFWIAGVAAAVLAAIAIGVFFVTNPLNRPPASAGPGVTTPTTSPSSWPPATATPFTCVTSSSPITSSTAPAVALIDALRTGTHAGYDRLTVEFKNGQPASIELRPQTGTTFTQGASGQVMTLAGTNGILVVIHGADLHTSYSGSTDIKTGYSALAEVRQVEDFEGVVQLGLGISGPACYQMSILSNPTRLVIDIQVP